MISGSLSSLPVLKFHQESVLAFYRMIIHLKASVAAYSDFTGDPYIKVNMRRTLFNLSNWQKVHPLLFPNLQTGQKTFVNLKFKGMMSSLLNH